MHITTITEARALVGRTFERDGKRRTVTKTERVGHLGLAVVWFFRNGDPCVPDWRYIEDFSAWLSSGSGATEVPE